jgi:hypothetical protein
MVDEDQHKERFKLVSDLFSKKKAKEFEYLIHQNVCNGVFLLGNHSLTSTDKPPLHPLS